MKYRYICSMGKKEINIMTCSKNELDLFFAKLKQDFANSYPVHVLDCGRVYLPVVGSPVSAIKKESSLGPLSVIKKWTLAKLQRFNFSHFKLFEKWKYK